MKTLKLKLIQILQTAMLAVMAMTAYADNGRLYTTDKLSSSQISCIGQDKYGYIWVGTENGLNKFDGYRFTHYYKDNTLESDTTQIESNEITDIFTDSEKRLWLGCNQGLMKYDHVNDRFKRYSFPDSLQPRVESIVEDASGDLIIGTAGYGLFKIAAGTDHITRIRPEGWKTIYDYANRLFIDRRGDIWLSNHISIITRIRRNNGKIELKEYASNCGPAINNIITDNRGFLIVCMYGILRYDYATGNITATDYDLSELNRKVSIRTAMTDHAGNIYIGTSGNGLMTIPRGSRKLIHVEMKDIGFDLSASNVNDIFEDKDNNLWVSCYKRGLYQLSQEKNAFRNFDFTSQNILLGSGISSMTEGEGGDVWVTVQKASVYKFDKNGDISHQKNSPYGSNTIYRDKHGNYWLCTENTLYAYNPYTGDYEERLRQDGWGLNCMTDDGNGHLYVCNYGKGLTVYDTATGKATSFRMGEKRAKGTLCNNWVKALFVDSKGLLWIGTANGLSCMDTRDCNFNVLKTDVMLKEVQCLSFNETADGKILIGTEKGLYSYDKDKMTIDLFHGDERVRNSSIYAIVVDGKGRIWLSTSKGVAMYDKGEQGFINYARGNGIPADEYILGAAVQFADDRIAFGTNGGITTFYPDEVKNSAIEIGEIHLTNFFVNGKPTYCFKDEFSLPYTSNQLQLEFSLLNFKHSEDIRFQYKINDAKKWETVKDGSNAIQFNELKPGKYEISVRAERNGRYSKEVKKITITVRPPWYSSPQAWFLYFILASSILTYALWRYAKNKREELEEAKMRFLINATHDIRSPLTLILAPLAKLKQKATDAESQEYIDTIDRNAKRLLTLVNQILDERKIDKNQMHLHCQQTDLVEQTAGVMSMFKSLARQRDITLRLESDDEVNAWVDRSNYDKIIQNLLSNAFKFTPDGGDIRISMEKDGKQATIRVTDTGTGFSEENTEKLFDRFYQGKNSTGSKSAGTGIGLNLCRTLIQMHGGKIKAENRNDGIRGAMLTITLPLGTAHLKPEEIMTADDKPETQKQSPVKRHASKNFDVMIVDDDPEITEYVKKELGEWYRTDCFGNGKDALKALLSKRYDIVISDIVMPDMDGITLLKSIKKNSLISDIPVILLTSKSDTADRMEGLKKGADAYLSKPFDMTELRVVIDNLVNKTRLLKGKYSGAQRQDDKMEQITVKGNNDSLMERIMKSVNKNISNPDFNVENLTEDVGISRAQLHRKMKEITGISAGEFIRNLRLEQATRLIREDKINITQVAYNVGFNNQTHFSTVFKKHFGMSPSEYAEKNRGKNIENEE